jgi:hypothetical protein
MEIINSGRILGALAGGVGVEGVGIGVLSTSDIFFFDKDKTPFFISQKNITIVPKNAKNLI